MSPKFPGYRAGDPVFDLSIVVPTHNRAALLERTLASLAELDIPSDVAVDLVVVANACTDRTLDVVHRAEQVLPYAVKTVEEPHAGLSLARNRGLGAAQADLIAFLDDDIWVERGWLRALVRAASHLPAGLLGGRVTLEWESCRPNWISPAVEGLLGLNDLGGEVRELVRSGPLRGGNFALRRSVVENVGDFSPSLGRRGSELLSGEESELGERALAAGHRIFYVPDMSVRHWIPRERATVEYLKAVAFGRGRSRVALQRTGPGSGAFACARLGVTQILLGGALALQGWLQRHDGERVAASLLCHRGLGTLFALMQAHVSVRIHEGRNGEQEQPVQTVQNKLMTFDAAVAGSAPKKATRRWKRLAFLTFPSLIMALMIFEVAGRWVLPASYLQDLPPKAIVPASKPLKPDSSAPHHGVTVDGKKLTLGDLSGILKEDDVLGYVAEPHARSVNGWWQSNNVGARSRMDTVREKPAGRKRVLVFGESFGQSCCVRQEDGWSERLGEKRGDLEVINFAVDGYGMGQSLLRFLRVRGQLEYDVVIFMLVPRDDLWRDINVVRFLGEGWKSYSPLPRYVLDGSMIRLVKSPYQSADEYYAGNIPRPNEITRSHLRSYDRFYFPLLYELPPLVGNLLVYKTFALWYGRWQYERLRADSFGNAHSEAVNLERGIFLAAKKQAQDDHAEFRLVMLPTTRDLDAIRRLSRYHPRWNEMAESMRQAGLKVVDLLPDFLALKDGDLDTGYDGSHYGPKANSLIAQMLAGKI